MNENQTLKKLNEDLEKQKQAALKQLAEAQTKIDEINEIERRLAAAYLASEPKQEKATNSEAKTKELELPGSFKTGNGVKGSLDSMGPLDGVGVRSDA